MPDVFQIAEVKCMKSGVDNPSTEGEVSEERISDPKKAKLLKSGFSSKMS
jgi:hypothetical protein